MWFASNLVCSPVVSFLTLYPPVIPSVTTMLPTFSADVTLTHKLIKNRTKNRSNTPHSQNTLSSNVFTKRRSQCNVLEIMDWETPGFWLFKQTEQVGDMVFSIWAVANSIFNFWCLVHSSSLDLVSSWLCQLQVLVFFYCHMLCSSDFR